MVLRWRILVCAVMVLMYIACLAISIGFIVGSSIGTQGVIVVDAGHGGVDGGVSESGAVEADINLKISHSLKNELESAGYRVVLTRTDRNSLAEGKKADMEERRKIIKRAKPLLTLSIHVNKYSDRSVRGVRVFYDDTARNKEYGEKVQYVMNSMINSRYVGRSDYKAQGGDYYITKCTDYPAIIVECGFISNSADRALLLNEKYQRELCLALVAGVGAATGRGV